MRNDYQIIDYASRARKVLLAYKLIADETIPVSLNSRLSSALGRCVFTINQINGLRKVKKIELQTKYFRSEKVSDNEIIATLIHEYLHSLFIYDGHTGKWKKYADYITATSCYNISRTTNVEEFDPYDSDDYKYELYCPECGMIMRKYKKITGIASHPSDYNHRGCHEKLKLRKIDPNSKNIVGHYPKNSESDQRRKDNNENSKAKRTYLEKPEQIRFDF